MSKQMDEEMMAKAAEGLVPPPTEDYAKGIRAGKPLPKGFVNPPCGTIGHRCLDEKRNYQPTWYQLMLRPPEGLQSENEYFALNGVQRRVTFNRWTDQPVWILSVLQDAVNMVFRQNVTSTGDLDYFPGTETTEARVTVTEEIPAFSYSALPSS